MAHRMFPYGRPQFQSVHPGEEAQTIHTQQVSSFELGYLEGSRYGKMHGMKTPEKDTDRMEFHANRGIHLRRHYEWGYIHGRDYAGNLKSGTKEGDKKAYKAQDERGKYLIKARDHGKKLAAVRFKKQRTTIVPSGTGFECKPPCGSCGTNKCKSYKEWNDKRIKQNIKDFETYGAKGSRKGWNVKEMKKGLEADKGKVCRCRGKQPEKVLGSYSSKGHRPQKPKPWTSKKGPGSGWHGDIRRHRIAALKGHRRMG